VLCNACGLFLKLHGRPRPISLKTDVIKSRNRVKTAAPRKRDSTEGQQQQQQQQAQQPQFGVANGYPAAHPDIAHAGLNLQHHMSTEAGASAPDPNSLSRTGTPSQSHNPNIAPPHIFDTVSLTTDNFTSPSMPAFAQMRQPSPGTSLTNGSNGTFDPNSSSLNAQHYETQRLTTRVNELEVINDLFRSRVAQLEQTERDVRAELRTKDEEARRSKADLETAEAKVADLLKRVAELEEDAQGSPARKRTRRSGPADEDEDVAVAGE